MSTKKKPHFVMLHNWFLDSDAWRRLTPNARCVYVALKRNYVGDNNGTISFSARQAGAAIGASHHTGNRAITELIDAGFVEVTEESNFNRKVKVARSYLLTEVPDDRPGRSRAPSKAFMRAPGKTKHSLMGEHDSRTHETVTAKTTAKTDEQSHPCDYEGPIEPGHSLTHATHVDIHHHTLPAEAAVEVPATDDQPPGLVAPDNAGRAGRRVASAELENTPILIAAAAEGVIPEVRRLLKGTPLERADYFRTLSGFSANDQMHSARRDLREYRKHLNADPRAKRAG